MPPPGVEVDHVILTSIANNSFSFAPKRPFQAVLWTPECTRFFDIISRIFREKWFSTYLADFNATKGVAIYSSRKFDNHILSKFEE